MCGFAGIVSWDQQHRVHRDVLERMSAHIAHRGPDDQGLWINHNDDQTAPDHPQAGLAFRRLSIIDLDPRSNQPFTNGRGQYLVFNGEIYNYRELRRELEPLLPDYPWRTTGDVEVLLASYAAWGQDCVNHLNGMFAFGVWDEHKRELFLARDRMGQKPLYLSYVKKDSGCHVEDYAPGVAQCGAPVNWVDRNRDPIPLLAIAFASEPASLLEVPWVDADVSQASVIEYLRWGYVPAPHTIYQGIQQLSPGCRTIVRPIEGARDQYFYPRYESFAEIERRRLDDPTAISRTRQLVSTAVQRQLVSDVPLGCFLSGGVDSSIIAAAAQRALPPGQRLQTFSIGFDDPRYDESEYAAAVAKHLGTEHHAFRVRPDAAADLPLLAKAFGEPFGDSSALPTHYLARETRRVVKVALSGDGGDELFAGYDRYRAIRLSQSLHSALTPIPWKLLAPLARALPGTHPKSRISRAKRFIQSVALPEQQRYSSYLRLTRDHLIAQLIQKRPFNRRPDSSTDLVQKLFGLERYLCQPRDVLSAALLVDRVFYLPNDLLTKVDRCSMLHALEVRSPFMDHELVDLAIYLTPSQLVKGGPKRMLREAFADLLPAWVFERKKMGFAVPIGEWFRADLRSMLHDHLFAANSFAAAHFNTPVVRRLVDEHETHRADHSQRLYALLMLELWWKTRT